MDQNDLTELYYITPIENVSSILKRGILSHKLAAALKAKSVANPGVQEIRAAKRVPGGLDLHCYANLYINGRNAMLYRLLEARTTICVLSVDTDVLSLEGVIVTDRNAATRIVRFRPVAQGLNVLEKARVFASSWNHTDLLAKVDHKQVMCAEVLVPEKVDPQYIRAVYVSGKTARDTVTALNTGLPVTVNSNLFFGAPQN